MIKKFTPIIFLFLLLIGGLAVAQDNRDKIESMRVAYLTKELDLSSKEAQTFWPVYNDYLDQLESLRKIRRQQLKKISPEQMNEKEAEQYIDSEIGFRLREAEIQKQYYSRFKQVLPVKKAALLIRAEENFKRELIKQLKDKSN